MTLGSRVARFLEERDRFDVSLLLIIISVIVYAGAGDLPFGDVLANALVAVTFIFVLHTASASWSVEVAGVMIVGALVVADVLTSIAFGSPAVTAPLAGMIFAFLTPIAILRRITRHRVVRLATVYGVLCIYVFVGLFFAYVYAGLDRLSPGFFVGVERATAPIDIYFSFVTLTTLGFGDFVPAADFGRMITVTEALMGQLYLVSAVALVVAGVGRERSALSGGSGAGEAEPRPSGAADPEPSDGTSSPSA